MRGSKPSVVDQRGRFYFYLYSRPGLLLNLKNSIVIFGGYKNCAAPLSISKKTSLWEISLLKLLLKNAETMSPRTAEIYLKDDKYRSLHLARKYSCVFVLDYYLFLTVLFASLNR